MASYQKNFSNAIYQSWLPDCYQDALQAEKERMWQVVREGLLAQLHRRPYRLAYVEVLKVFSIYIDSKHDISDEEALFAAETLLALILHDDEDHLKNLVMNARILLLLLDRPPIPGLVIPWKPFFDLIQSYFFAKKRNLLWFPKQELGPALVKLVREARCYFTDTAAEEILAELRPYLCPHDQDIFRAQGYIALFLPTRDSKLQAPCQVPAEERPRGKPATYHWLDEMLAVMGWTENVPGWSTQYMELFARAAKDGLGVIDWAPYCKFLFTNILDLVANTGTPLPVGSVAYPQCYGLALPKECGVFFPSADHTTRCMRSLARLAVFMITPTSACVQLLAEMLSYIEPYYHPSNYGGWTIRLVQFTRSLCSSFARRVGSERKLAERQANGEQLSERQLLLLSLRMTDEQVEKFIGILLPPLFKALYSKSSRVTEQAGLSIKTLAQVSPQQVFPELLETILPDLKAVEQTHRTQSALEVLGYTVRPLLWHSLYPEGAGHLTALLGLTLPGIDPNDLVKTHATLRFYLAVMMCVPLSSSPASTPDETWSETDRKVLACTEFFGDWSMQLLQRVLVLYTLCVEAGSNGSSLSMESVIHVPVQQLLTLLYSQASPAIYDALLHHFHSFVTTNYVADAVVEVGKLCCVISAANPKTALKLFVHHYFLVLLEKVPGSGEKGEPEYRLQALSESELAWSVTMLSQAVKLAGTALLAHKTEIDIIIACVLRSPLASRTRNLWRTSCKLLRCVLKALTTIYLLEYKSSPPSEMEKQQEAGKPWEHWGEPVKPEELSPSWHVPGDDEIAWAVELVNLYCGKAVENAYAILEEILAPLAGSDKEAAHHIPASQRRKLWNEMAVIHMASRGAALALVDVSEEGLAKMHETVIEGDTFYDRERCSVPSLPLLAIPDINKKAVAAGLQVTRQSLGRVVYDVVTRLLDAGCDDTRLFSSIAHMLQQFINYPFGNAMVLFLQRKATAAESQALSNHVYGKESEVRWLMLQRAEEQQRQRLCSAAFHLPLTPMHFSLFGVLLRLSTNPYSSVRSTAQEVLHTTYRFFTLPARVFGPAVLDLLANSSSSPSQVTGAIYILHNMLFLSSIIRDWELLHKLFLSVIDCQAHEKASVQSRVNSLLEAIASVFVRGQLRPKALSDGPGDGPPLVTAEDEARLQQEGEENVAKYTAMVTSLAKRYREGLPWVYALKVGTFLVLLVREDVPPSSEHVGVFLDMLQSDISMLRTTAMSGLTRVMAAVKPHRPRVPYRRPGASPGTPVSLERLTDEEIALVALPVITTAEEWEACGFQDKNYFGWNGIQPNAKAYAPLTPEGHEAMHAKVRQTPAGAAILAAFAEESLWSHLLANMTSEPKPVFSNRVAYFFKSAFQLAGRRLLDLLLPKVRAMCTNWADPAEQALGCQILAGAARGSKHWQFEDVRYLQAEVLVPLILQSATSSPPECYGFWSATTNFVVYDRDIRRLQWLHAMLRKEIFNPADSSLVQARKLGYATTTFAELSWRGRPYGGELIEQVAGRTGLSIDRKVLQETSANLLAIVLNATFDGCRLPCGRPALIGGSMPLDAGQVALVKMMVEQLESIDAQLTTFTQTALRDALKLQLAKEKGGEDAMADVKALSLQDVREGVLALKKQRAMYRKVVLNWVVLNCRIGGSKVLSDYIEPLLACLFEMRDDEDPQLLDLSMTAIGYVANANTPKHRVVALLNTCYGLLGSRATDWHARVSILPFLQVLVFRNILELGRDELDQLIGVLLAALVDPQLEVRAAASTTLAGVLKFVNDEAFLADLLDKFRQTAAAAELPKRKELREALAGPERNQTIATIIQRHSAVLGMAALVGVHPYGIPSWLPQLLVDLALHIHDPSPIKETVTKTFLEFWRVHQDAWAEEQLEFTSEQLSLLTELLVAPSYFG